jgi:predicted negative regulator of RcsB-dependent stress response
VAYDEDEQVQRLQQWWSENWKALVGGLVIGVAGILGWNAWQSHGERKAEAASALFAEVLSAADAGNREAALAARETLVSDYRGTPYAVAASLQVAALHARQGELEQAASALSWASEHADDPAMGRLAEIRLARVRWAQGDADAALALLEGGSGHFRAVAEELRGDILIAQGERAAAHRAYSQALAVAPQESRELLRQKLDDLADVANADTVGKTGAEDA